MQIDKLKVCCAVAAALMFRGNMVSAQEDSLRTRELEGVEVVAHRRPATTRSAAPLQVLDRKGIEQLGVQDLSEAVKRFSGVTVQDYGGVGGLKTVSVRSLGAKHTAVSYDGVTITDWISAAFRSTISSPWHSASDKRTIFSRLRGCMPLPEP